MTCNNPRTNQANETGKALFASLVPSNAEGESSLWGHELSDGESPEGEPSSWVTNSPLFPIHAGKALEVRIPSV